MIEFTKEHTEKFAEWIFNESFPDRECGEWKDQDGFVQNDWIKIAVRAINAYEDVMKFLEVNKDD